MFRRHSEKKPPKKPEFVERSQTADEIPLVMKKSFKGDVDEDEERSKRNFQRSWSKKSELDVTVRNLADRFSEADSTGKLRQRWKIKDEESARFRRRVSINLAGDFHDEKFLENLEWAIRGGNCGLIEKMLSNLPSEELETIIAGYLYTFELGVEFVLFSDGKALSDLKEGEAEVDQFGNLREIEIVSNNKKEKKNLTPRKFTASDRADVTITPLQLAVLSRKVEVVNLLLTLGEQKFDFDYALNMLQTGVKVHFRGHNSADYSRPDRALHGMTAVHLAAKYSSTSLNTILTFLTENMSLDSNAIEVVGKCVSVLENSGGNEFRRTPLHYAAAFEKDTKALKSLLEFGVEIDPRDDWEQTPLHVAKTDQAILLLLECGADPEARAKIHSYKARPLHRAKSPKIVQLLLDFNANPYSCMVNEAKKKRISAIERLLARNTKSASVLLDSFVTSNTDDVDSSDFILIFDFRVFKEEAQLSQTSVEDEMLLHSKVLYLGLKDVLKHPILESFLSLKWSLTKKFFYINLLLYFIFTLSLTSVALMVTEIKTKCPNNQTTQLFSDCLDSPSRVPQGAFEPIFYTCVIFSVLFLIRESTQLILTGPRTFLKNKENILEFFLLTATFAYFASVFSFSQFSPALGAISVLLAWMDLTLLIGRFPAIGIYIFMSTHVMKLLFIFFLVYVTSLIAFAFSFHILLPDVGVFSDPFTSFMKVITMMLGEFDFADNFLYSTSPPGSKGVLQLIFMMFFFLVSIIICNLIIGLTVSKTDELFKEAGIIRMQKSILQIRELETIFLRGFINKPFFPAFFGEKLLQGVQLFPNLSLEGGEETYRVCVQPMRDARSKILLDDRQGDLFSSLETSLDSQREHAIYLFNPARGGRVGKRLGKTRLPDWIIKRGIEIIEARNNATSGKGD